MRQALIAAFKRNDRKAILAEVLQAEGLAEQAQEVRDAARVTSALIDRVCINDDAEPTYAETDEANEEPVHGSVEEHNEIVDAIKSGKKKKAKKLLKAAIEGGAKGSSIKEFKKQIKEL